MGLKINIDYLAQFLRARNSEAAWLGGSDPGSFVRLQLSRGPEQRLEDLTGAQEPLPGWLTPMAVDGRPHFLAARTPL